MILTALSSSSISWLVAQTVICVVAGIGGAIVFIGLWMEGAPDEKEFRDITEYRQHKAKSKRGWRWLMVGIVVEIIVAVGLAAKDGLDVRDAIKTNRELEAKMAWRMITVQQRSEFIDLVKNYPKGKIWFSSVGSSQEVDAFTIKLHDLLVFAGYDCPGKSIDDFGRYGMVMGSPIAEIEIGVINATNVANHAFPLVGALQKIGFDAKVVLDSRAFDGISLKVWPKQMK